MPARATDTPPGYYLLFALNGEGVPSVGKIVKVDIPAEPPPQDTTAPSTPAGLAITKVQGNPRLTWNAATDNVGVAGYAIHRSTDGTVGPGNHSGSRPRPGPTVRCKRARSIRMRSRRYDAAGNLSPASAKRTITAFQLPSKPRNLVLQLVNKDPQLNFTRSTDNVGVVGYNVYRSTNGTLGPLFQQIAGPGWIDTSAQQGVRYTYAVRARDAAGYLSHATPLRTITAQ